MLYFLKVFCVNLKFIFVDQIPHFLELNSIPGMTNESIFPKQAKNIGISVKEIIDELIELSLIHI